MENDVVLAEPQPVPVHRPPADNDPMGMQYALWLSGRTRSKDEDKPDRRARSARSRRERHSAASRRASTGIEHAKMRKSALSALFLGSGSQERSPPRPNPRRQRQRPLARSRAATPAARRAADGDRRKEGQHEIDVVLGSSIITRSPFLRPPSISAAGELAKFIRIEVAGIGPRTKRARPVAQDRSAVLAAIRAQTPAGRGNAGQD